MASVVMRNVRKQFGDTVVVPDASLTIEDNEFVVFVGPSGCGKSTLLRLLAGLEELSGGSIEIDGQRIDHLSPSKRGLAMVFQSYALYPHMTVFENMSYALRVAGASREEIARKVGEAADILQLTDYLKRKPRELSGGQRQRVAIGRAIVRDPRVFLFDEPLSNLDAKLRVQMRIEISKLHRRLNATMVYVTHDQVEAMTMADKIVVLRDGVIEQVGAPLDLYNRPDNIFVAGFIGSPAMNFFTAQVAGTDAGAVTIGLADDGGTLTIPCDDSLRVSVGDAVTLGVRPEHFLLDGPADASIAGQVTEVERLGGETYVYMSGPKGQDIVVHTPGDRPVALGDTVRAGISRATAHLFGPDGLRIGRSA